MLTQTKDRKVDRTPVSQRLGHKPGIRDAKIPYFFNISKSLSISSSDCLVFSVAICVISLDLSIDLS